MAKQNTSYKEEENKKKGFIISLICHFLLLLLLLLPFFIQPELPQSEGILIAFGDPEAGSNSAPEIMEETTEETSPATSASTSIANNEALSSKDQVDEAPIKAIEKKVNKPIDSQKNKVDKELAAAKTRAAEAAKIAKDEADRKLAEKEKEDKQAAEKAAAAANQKKKYADLLGKGKGNNNNSGNQGASSGDPDGQALNGISKGTGRVGGGLSGRGIEYSPSFTDNSQKTGKVSLSICVNTEGKVIKAEFTQKGSTTSDSYLIDLARKTAMKYKFSKSDADSQCGTVTIDFKVQ